MGIDRILIPEDHLLPVLAVIEVVCTKENMNSGMLLMVFTLLVTPEEKALLLGALPRLLIKIGILFLTEMHPLVIGNMIFLIFPIPRLLKVLPLLGDLWRMNVDGLESPLHPDI